jgi:uncharacterized protein with NAD-binding domain and iron-sulfur cluster
MQAGMGEVVFTPFYEVLKSYGVKFEFFHRVHQLKVQKGTKGLSIGEVQLFQQAKVISKNGYNPLFPLAVEPSILAWPSEPDYAQLKNGSQFKKINLEAYSGNPYETPVSLKAGKDFDMIISGISVGALPQIAAELSEHHAPFKTMLDHSRTTDRMDIQMWLKPSLEELGFTGKGAGNINGYQPPLHASAIDSWNDFSDLLPTENWGKLPESERPKSKAFLEGTIADNLDHKDVARQWLNNSVKPLWPKAVDEKNPHSALPGTGIDWSLLLSPQNLSGENRLNDQYVPIIPNPSDRYVQLQAGSTKYRLYTNQSGAKNLLITGDWIRTPINVGAAEAAVMAGLQTANAILGKDLYDGIDY